LTARWSRSIPSQIGKITAISTAMADSSGVTRKDMADFINHFLSVQTVIRRTGPNECMTLNDMRTPPDFREVVTGRLDDEFGPCKAPHR
jgi:hypothetical protein